MIDYKGWTIETYDMGKYWRVKATGHFGWYTQIFDGGMPTEEEGVKYVKGRIDNY